MPPPSLPIILLKNKSSPSDPYDVHFRSTPLLPNCPTEPIFVPVLQHQHTNLTQLRDILVNGGVDGRSAGTAQYTGLIITSQRAVEALQAVLQRLKEEGTVDLTPLFAHTPVFVVGPATAAAVTGLGFHPDKVLGADCGCGAVLAPFILSQLPVLFPERAPNFLFLVGETRRDVIQNSLRSAAVGMTELVVYETTVVDTFRDDLVRVLEETEEKKEPGKEGHAGERWAMVFSPQGADVAVQALKDKDVWGRTLVAAIGPTTEQRLTEMGRRPDAVAKKPSPEGLWEVVKEEMERRNAG